MHNVHLFLDYNSHAKCWAAEIRALGTIIYRCQFACYVLYIDTEVSVLYGLNFTLRSIDV